MMGRMDVAPIPAPVDLGPGAVIHLADDLVVTAAAVDAAFWNRSATTRPELIEGRILSVFDYTTTWSWWERHPAGDELVYLISGDIELLLDDPAGARTLALQPGQAAIVPAGAWHRAVVLSPSQLMFVTPTPARTEHREVTPDDDVTRSDQTAFHG
jgi:quercetin dioxygenase-like cupin family protein